MGRSGRSQLQRRTVMTVSSDRLLRRTLWANAAFSIASGAVLALFATPFAAAASAEQLTVAGLDLAIALELLGIGVIAAGALCASVAGRPELPRGLAKAIFAADISYVAASVVVLELVPWTTAGIAAIAIVALIVADLAVLQDVGLRRLLIVRPAQQG